ncbi:hypothetical protein C8J44_1119 [Sphingomonas sp. PP-CE-3A-406]|nr:hypothetical protein C8J44_1119 [Sphingomonas sp. PP-CE-3A-406]
MIRLLRWLELVVPTGVCVADLLSGLYGIIRLFLA